MNSKQLAASWKGAMALSKTEIDRAFALIEEAAVKGERCPQNHPHGPLHALSVVALYESGRIFGEIIGRNYRVVTILTGRHAGKSTAPSPDRAAPWRSIGRAKRINGKVVADPRTISAARRIGFAERQKIAP